MATVSSHVLDSIAGKSAVGIRVQLFQLHEGTDKELVFDVSADGEGRIAETVSIGDTNSGSEFELVFGAAEYFRARGQAFESMVSEVVIRFVMSDDRKRYHLPVMLSPHSYSTWWPD